MPPPARTSEDPPAVVSQSSMDAQFDRHFAAMQVKSDIWGTRVGALVYLALIPSLLALRRPDAAVGAAAAAAACMWPFVLNRWARRFYLSRRDYLLALHFAFHYAVGFQLSRFVQMYKKVNPGTPAAFYASFFLTSTLPWQSLDALMYRMRWRRFLVCKPLVLLLVMPQEMLLCRRTCADLPGFAHLFHALAQFLRTLLSPFRLVPLPAMVHAADTDITSCFKSQAFMMAALAWLLPAWLLWRLEWQAQLNFRQECEQRALIVPDAEAAADAALEKLAALLQAGLCVEGGNQGAAAAVAEAATAADFKSSSPSWAEVALAVEQRHQELVLRWRQQQLHLQQQQHEEQRAGSKDEWAHCGLIRAVQGLVAASLAWHVIDVGMSTV
ncbi:hypothetical protein ABPG75_008388 [Micractinium tetrahymenae]